MSMVDGEQPRFDRWGAELLPHPARAAARERARARTSRVRVSWVNVVLAAVTAGAAAVTILHLAGIAL
jgi:hypothetical protein